MTVKKISIFTTTIFCLILLSKGSKAQFDFRYIDLEKNSPKLHLTLASFNDVKILDNRFDTTTIYISQNGNLPAIAFAFKPTAATAMRNYITRSIAGFALRDKKTLLININQFRITNKTRIQRKDWSRKKRSRDFLLLNADVYSSAGNGYYKKILTVNKKEVLTYSFIKETIAETINTLIEASSVANTDSIEKSGISKKKLRYLFDDSLSFHFIKSSETFTLDQINGNVRNRWKEYPVFNCEKPFTAAFLNFDDFRDNKGVPCFVKKYFNSADSLFEIEITMTDSSINKKILWAVFDSGDFYIRLTGNRYLKMSPSAGSFYFSVPSPLPDMYSMLSLEQLNSGNTYASSGSSGNFLFDLAGIAVTATAEKTHKKNVKNKIEKNNQYDLYRRCFIDMDTGDIIYSSE